MEIARLDRDFSTLKMHIAPKVSDSVVEQLSTALSKLQTEISVLWRFPAVPRFDSRIILNFQEDFAEFRVKQFSHLWRVSCDGFKDGENTLTVILGRDGNIFSGFTSVEWESQVWNGDCGDGNNCLNADDSLKSVIFHSEESAQHLGQL
jgi:hypothetical protein